MRSPTVLELEGQGVGKHLSLRGFTILDPKMRGHLFSALNDRKAAVSTAADWPQPTPRLVNSALVLSLLGRHAML